MAKFCMKCGTQLPEGAGFCQRCGTAVPKDVVSKVDKIPPAPQEKAPQMPPVPVPSAAPAMPQVQNISSEEKDSETKKTAKKKIGKTKKIAISIVSVVLVIAIVASAIFLIPRLGLKKSGEETPAEETPAAAVAKDIGRTVMVYFIGSDLESLGGCASTDIGEIVSADIDTEKNNVLVYTGGTYGWSNPDISAESNSIFLVENGALNEVETYEVKDMAEPATLTEFLEYGKTNYPADEYDLILWNHGGGPINGYGYDEVFGNMFSLETLAMALENSPFSGNEKLEMIGFDACLMGSAETAWMLRDYADYFVASQEVEYGEGWNFAFLERLGECANGGELGKLIIETFFECFESTYDEEMLSTMGLTLSCTDLSKIETVEQAIDDLFSVVNTDVVSGNITEVSRCRHRTRSFGKTEGVSDVDMIDLVHLTSQLKSFYPEKAEALEKALDDYIVYNESNLTNANGVSIYHPYESLWSAESSIETYKTFGFSENYGDYIENFYNQIVENGDSTENYKKFSQNTGTVVDSDNKSEISMQLTEEQLETFASAEYMIFTKYDGETSLSRDDNYLYIFSGSDVTLSDDGKLSATYEGKAVYATSPSIDGWTEHPLVMGQVYKGEGDVQYYFPCLFEREGMDDDDTVNVNWFMTVKDGKPVLARAYALDYDEEGALVNRNYLDPDDYDTYTFSSAVYTLKENGNGEVQMELTDTGAGYWLDREEGFELDFKPIENKEDYCAVFVVTDIYGNKHISGQIPLA